MEVDIPDLKSVVKISTEDLDMDRDRVRVRRKSLQTVLEQCQRALELLNSTNVDGDGDGEESSDGEPTVAVEHRRLQGSPSVPADREAEELCDLLKSRVECPAFLEKLECAQASVSLNSAEDGSSWDMISDNDLWEGENIDSDQDFVLVRQEDIVEGIACFMAAYLLSLKQTKDLTPNQLQEALSKTFSMKNKKGKLQKAWDGSKVIYNVASWGATAIGLDPSCNALKRCIDACAAIQHGVGVAIQRGVPKYVQFMILFVCIVVPLVWV